MTHVNALNAASKLLSAWKLPICNAVKAAYISYSLQLYNCGTYDDTRIMNKHGKDLDHIHLAPVFKNVVHNHCVDNVCR